MERLDFGIKWPMFNVCTNRFSCCCHSKEAMGYGAEKGRQSEQTDE